MGRLGVEDHGGGHHRASQGPAAGFIHARDPIQAVFRGAIQMHTGPCLHCPGHSNS